MNNRIDSSLTQQNASNRQNLTFVSWGWTQPQNDNLESEAASQSSASQPAIDSPLQAVQIALRAHSQPARKPFFDLLRPLRQWLDNMQISDRELAHSLCKLIPSQCPFERDVKFFGKHLFHIPPLCKFNPLYEEVVGLRFRAMCYLADQCGEDVSVYC
jgi:hypothetical protein